MKRLTYITQVYYIYNTGILDISQSKFKKNLSQFSRNLCEEGFLSHSRLYYQCIVRENYFTIKTLAPVNM